MNAGLGYYTSLLEAKQRTGSALCVGLDPDPELLPAGLSGIEGMRTLLLAAIDATADLACAYKPNLAFFERFGSDGWKLLEEVLAAIPEEIPTIADGKRGDIGNTSAAYAEALFTRLRASACTANPYLGVDALQPLLEHPRGYTYILCRTSNPGALALQDLIADGLPIYAHVLRLFEPWLRSGAAGLVIGSSQAAAFSAASSFAPEASILIPGIGAQGGTVEELAALLSPAQRRGAVVSASRSVLHAGREHDYASAIRSQAIQLHRRLQQHLAAD